MKLKNKKQSPKIIPYCKDCQFYIAYSSDIINIGKDNEDGLDICGHSINTHKNHIGYESFVTQGDLQQCGECGAILQDDRRLIYRKCKAKNRRNACKDFIKITNFQLLKNRLKSIIINVKNMLKTFNITKSYILLFWLIFNIIFLIHNDVFLSIGVKEAFYYLLITVTFFGVSMRK